MRKLLISLMLLLIASPVWATTYYVDYVGGDDSNNGTSSGTAWQHCPGDANATSTAGSANAAAGDIFLFKRGVTYIGLITVDGAGSLITGGSTASVTGSVLTDANEDFTSDGVSAVTDYIYIYHSKNSRTETWIESTGFFPIDSVDSSTEVTMTGYDGVAYSTTEITFDIWRPIVYTSDTSYGGTADAVLTGSDTRPTIFAPGSNNYIMVKNLHMIDTVNDGDDKAGAIETTSNITGFALVDCEMTDLGSSTIRIGIGSQKLITQRNVATRVAYKGIGGLSKYGLHEDNTIVGEDLTCRAGIECYGYCIARGNYATDMTQAYSGKHQDAFGIFDRGSTVSEYGWVYNNYVDNSVEMFAFYAPTGGVSYWTIMNNIIVGRGDQSGFGDAGFLIRDTTDTKFYNNLWFSPVGGGLSNAIRMQTDAGSGNINMELKNNIFHSLDSASTVLYAQAGGYSGFAADYNQYYQPTSNPDMFLGFGGNNSWSAWADTLGFDANGAHYANTQPSFVDTSAAIADRADLDFNLQSDSLAIDTGTDLSAYLTKDYAGNVRTGTWDIGPYEYISGEATYHPSFKGGSFKGGSMK